MEYTFFSVNHGTIFFFLDYQSTIFFFFENQSTIFFSKKTRTPPLAMKWWSHLLRISMTFHTGQHTIIGILLWIFSAFTTHLTSCIDILSISLCVGFSYVLLRCYGSMVLSFAVHHAITQCEYACIARSIRCSTMTSSQIYYRFD